MTPEQREIARRFIDPLRIVAEHKERFHTGPKGDYFGLHGNRYMADKARADANALRAVLALIDADEAGEDGPYCDCGHHLMPCGCCERDGCRCERENAP